MSTAVVPVNTGERAARRADLARLKELLDEQERREARKSLAVYAGMHVPAEIEDEEVDHLYQLSQAARYIPAQHHQLLIEKLEAVERGEIKRLAVFMPPGSAKSTYTSVMFPPWFLGRNPAKNVIGLSHTQPLADKFGRRARNIVGSEVHQKVFQSGLARDQKASATWETDRGGTYLGAGVGVGIAGNRADLALIDDPIRSRQDADSLTIRDKVWECYTSDLRPRLKPDAAIVLVQTRWHEDDLAGRILPKESIGKSGWIKAKDGELWYVLTLVAVVETPDQVDTDPLGREIGDILWPEWFTPQMLAQEKRTQGSRNWSALYQQNPRDEEGGILPRNLWRRWPESKPPRCELIISVYDTAFEEDEENDPSARTTWGIFWHETEAPPEVQEQPQAGPRRVIALPKPSSGEYCAILLERFNERVAFPALRKLAKEHYDKFQPDWVLVEKKASGHSLIQELRRKNVPVKALKADRSKLARAHAVSAVLEAGLIWYMDKPWAQEVIDQCAAFPNGAHDDMVDTCVHAWHFLRRTWRLMLKGEDDDNEDDDSHGRKRSAKPIYG